MGRDRRKQDRTKPRRQFAALPCMPGKDGPLVMLVTSRGTGRWVLPKGWPKKRLSAPELAALEAFEEAGLVGDVAPGAIGAYRYPKRLPNGAVVVCDVDVYPMAVARQLDDWPERAQRRRRWFTLAEAAGAVKESDLTALLLLFAADAGKSRP